MSTKINNVLTAFVGIFSTEGVQSMSIPSSENIEVVVKIIVQIIIGIATLVQLLKNKKNKNN